MKFQVINRKHRSILYICAALTVLFWSSAGYFLKSYDDMQGAHCWISAHTIQSVNCWLKESPLKLHFVSYLDPDSIEFGSISERSSYTSYPSGQLFFVYLFAKPYTMLRGREVIGIKFLKHLQMLFFWAETLLFGIFIYRFASRTLFRREEEKIAVSVALPLFWAWIPVNTYYLSNVYFSDQCVILFVMAFLLLEYESLCCTDRRRGLTLNILKAAVIYAGSITDYYFWIMVFVAFLLHTVQLIVQKHKQQEIVHAAIWYILPVALALVTFLCQLISVPGWKGKLLGKFLFRAGISPSKYNIGSTILAGLILFATAATGIGIRKSILILACVCCANTMLAGNSTPLQKYKDNFERIVLKEKKLLSNNCIIIITGMLSPILQIALLRNHSSIHEFSMIKLGWCVTMLILVVPEICSLLSKGKRESISQNERTSSFVAKNIAVSLVAALLLTGIPFTSIEYNRSRREYENNDYTFAETVRDNTSYNHVCFSFSREIPVFPPQQLAVSRKRVYKISSTEEIESLFPALPEAAAKVLVIDKTDDTLPEELKKQQNRISAMNECIFENDTFSFIKVKQLPE